MSAEPMYLYRLHDGPAMWRKGKRTTPRPGATGVSLFGELTTLMRDCEVYRMRTRPELYDDAERDTFLDARAAEAERLGVYDWDCSRCRRAVMTPELTDSCPNCCPSPWRNA